MKYTLHTLPVNGGAFNCQPARSIELEGERILCNSVFVPILHGSRATQPLWVIGNEYGALCAVFADHEQDALDEATDKGWMDSFLVSAEDQEAATEAEREEWAHLGNAGEAADLSYCWLQRVGFDGGRDCLLVAALAYANGAGLDTLENV
jgi:hypothetical protein